MVGLPSSLLPSAGKFAYAGIDVGEGDAGIAYEHLVAIGRVDADVVRCRERD